MHCWDWWAVDMAMYRIKPADVEPPPLPPEEYWRETRPEHARDLDLDEIAALNRAADEEDAFSDEKQDPAAAPIKPFRSTWLRVLLALAVIIAFSAWTAGDLLGERLDIGFLQRSAELAKDRSLADLQAAVVTVDCAGSSGSGFNIDASGLIVTNAHVVENGGIITVKFPDGSRYDTRGYHLPVEGVDLALVDIAGEDLPAVTLADALPAAGDPLIFIGNPLGYDWTISEATALGTLLLGEEAVLCLSGPVRSGSSGSPVFDQEACVVGVIFATLSDEDDVGLVVPVTYLNQYLEDMKE